MHEPDWAQDLPAHIRLGPSQIERLEIIRAAVRVPHGDFHLHILSHPECSKMLQRRLYQRYRAEQPGQSEDYYLSCIVWSRYATAQLTGYDLFGLKAVLPNAEALNDPERALSAVVKVVRARGWNDIEEVAQAIADEENSLPQVEAAPGNAEAVNQVRLILQEHTGS